MRIILYGFATTVTAVFAVAPANTVAPIQPVSQSVPSQLSQLSGAQIWNLKNADIRAVIQTVSILTGKNFIVDPRVHGTITLMSQKPMTPNELYQVFLSMLQLLQYDAISSGNVIKIVPAMDANVLSRQIATSTQPGMGNEVVVRVVPVNHVSATELIPILRPLMSQSGSISAYFPSNSIILAGTASNIARLVQIIHQMDSQNANQITVMHLQYANAKKIVSVIHALQTGSASQGVSNIATLAADEDDNTILISGNAANQMVMRNLIRQLDQKGSSGDDTKVVTLNYLSAKKLAPILAKVAKGINNSNAVKSGKGTSADVFGDSDTISVQAEDSSNAIIIHAPKATMKSLLHVIHQLDVKPQEVLVEAIIVKLDESVLDKLGIVWGTSDGNTMTSGNVTMQSAALAASNTFAINANHGVGFLPDGNLIALLHALKSDGSSDILSTPSVVVLNNNKAIIDDGQNIGVANRSYQGATAMTTGNPAQNEVTPFNTIERQDVTLSLSVTPHISPNNMIRLALIQKDDTVAADNTTPSESDSTNPTLNTSKIATDVLVKSGDVLVLGGLMSKDQEKTKEAIPILGNLPLIGQLFRYNTHSMEKKNLMVFIRPIIMSKDMASAQTMNRYVYARHQQVDLQTQHIRKIDHLPLLPQLDHQNNIALPAPTETEIK